MAAYVGVWLALRTDRRAVTSLEYGVVAAILVGVIFAGFQLMATKLSTEFSSIGAGL